MRLKVATGVLGWFVLCAVSVAQRGPSRANPDQLGLTCAQVMAMSSTDWVAKFDAAKGTDAAQTIRAITAYGKCYDVRTDQLAASLGRSGKGPLMGARGDFGDLENAIKSFATKAVVESQPPADAVKKAYAALYEKQFRYQFYESYVPKPAAASSPKTDDTASTAPSASAGGGAAVDTAAAAEAKAAKDEADQKKSDADPVTQAKNHFGGLLGELPDTNEHDLHSAFGEILGPNAASPRIQLLVYRYAIFLLEPAGKAPFSPPPF
jgi:hypothetical protein